MHFLISVDSTTTGYKYGDEVRVSNAFDTFDSNFSTNAAPHRGSSCATTESYVSSASGVNRMV